MLPQFILFIYLVVSQQPTSNDTARTRKPSRALPLCTVCVYFIDYKAGQRTHDMWEGRSRLCVFLVQRSEPSSVCVRRAVLGSHRFLSHRSFTKPMLTRWKFVFSCFFRLLADCRTHSPGGLYMTDQQFAATSTDSFTI